MPTDANRHSVEPRSSSSTPSDRYDCSSACGEHRVPLKLFVESEHESYSDGCYSSLYKPVDGGIRLCGSAGATPIAVEFAVECVR